jgi:putative ABC transport system permease protein
VARSQDIGIHPPVLLFTLAASLVTGLLVGLLPALRAQENFDVLREGARGGTSRFTLFGRSLVVAEIALALMLVTGAGLLLKSYARATNAQLGFDPRGMITASLYFPPSRYADGAASLAFTEQLLDQLRSRPEVTGLAMASMVPIRESGNNFTSIGLVGSDAKASFVENRFVSPDYFETMGIRLLQGRLHTPDEARNQTPVAVIGRTLARTLAGDGDAVGQRLEVSPTFQLEIIGVVDDVRESRPDLPPRPVMYRPLNFTGNLLVQTSRDVAATTALLREAARTLDPEVSVLQVQSMAEIVDASLSGRRFQLTLIGVFALTALLLACVGIYGVLSYTVTRQSREIGVRMALGARSGSVARHVAWRGGRLALAGIAFGMGGALLLRRVIETQLFEVETFDPAVYFGVAGMLLAVATAACFLPARRAALVQPTQALRIE